MVTARGRPIGVDDEFERVGDGWRAGAPFTNDFARSVEELDPVLHAQ